MSPGSLDETLAILDAPCKQWKTVMSNICDAAGLKDEMKTYPTCPGHMAFVADARSGTISDACSECGDGPPIELDSESSYQYVPLIPRLRAMIARPQSCEELYVYRRTRDPEEGTIRDYFDGEAYRKLCSKLGGEDVVKDDIFLRASTDGFSPYKNRNYDVWSIAVVNFNLPPHQRYLPQNVLPIVFVPGPRQPKNLQSFLLPLVNELKEAASGLIMNFPYGSHRRVRVHLICFTGDQPAVCKTAGLIGPNGRTPCRDCKVQGYYTNHYYFPSKIKIVPNRTRVLFNLRRLPLRNISETRQSISLIKRKSGTEKKELQTNTGNREDSVLLVLPTMFPYCSFPHDIIYTFYNIQNELLRIILGPFEDQFSIDRAQLAILDEELEHWKWGVSGQLGPKPKRLSKYKEWKAAGHKTFSISRSLVLFDGYLPSDYLDGLAMFSEVVDICTRSEVTPNDLQRVRQLSVRFVEHYERYYFRYREDRVDFCKSVFHILLHLADCMKNFGPLVGVSQYWLEGHIGCIVGRNNARTRPAQSMLKNALFGESLKLFYETGVFDKNADVPKVVEKGGYILLGKPKVFALSKMPHEGRQIRRLITDYLCRKYQISDSQAKSIASIVNTIISYSGLKFIVGYDTQAASVYFRPGGREPKKSSSRPSYYVAVKMENDPNPIHEIWYGRVLRLMTFDLSFLENDLWGYRHDVAVMDWAEALQKGPQGQIYTQGRAVNAFSSNGGGRYGVEKVGQSGRASCTAVK